MNLEFLKRTTFWTIFTLVVGTWITQFTGYLPTEGAAMATIAATGSYALSRGLAKYSNDMKNGLSTTEFWVGVAGVVIVVVAAFDGALSVKMAESLALIQGGVYALSRGLAKSPEDEVEY